MARDDGKSELQHYVPRLLLRMHANDATTTNGNEQVWCFDKKTDKIFSVNIKKIAAETNFYELDMGEFIASLEGALSTIEAQSKPILINIITQRSLNCLTKKDRNVVATFMAVQFIRTQAFRETVSAFNNRMADTMLAKEMNPAFVEDFRILDKGEVKHLSLSMLAKAPEVYTPHFLDKHWFLIEATNEDPFHIGDNPVVRDNDLSKGQAGTLGLACAGISIYLPLSPTLCIAMIDAQMILDIKKDFNKARRHFQKVRKQAARRLRQGPLAKLTSLLEENEKMEREMIFRTRSVINGGPTSYDTNVVMRVNSLQMRYASRWVMSSRNDFTLPKQMIARDEGYREGFKW